MNTAICWVLGQLIPSYTYTVYSLDKRHISPNKSHKSISSQPFTKVIFFVSFTGLGKSTLIGHALKQLGVRGPLPATGARGSVTRAVQGYAATVDGWTIGGPIGWGKSSNWPKNLNFLGWGNMMGLEKLGGDHVPCIPTSKDSWGTWKWLGLIQGISMINPHKLR